MNREVKHSVLRYFGGKWGIAPWILSFMPSHKVYVEPFGGGGSILLRKPRSHTEVYNDLDGEVVNVFRVLRDKSNELIRALDLTPYSREEYYSAYSGNESIDDVERARRAIVRAFMGFGSDAIFNRDKTGFRAVGSEDSGVSCAKSWDQYVDTLLAVVDRLKGVLIENKNAAELIPVWDKLGVVFYIDPPYVAETRASSKKHKYNYEMTSFQHKELLQLLCGLKGTVILSGYENDLYGRYLSGWERHTKKVFADTGLAEGADRERIEVIWIKR